MNRMRRRIILLLAILMLLLTGCGAGAGGSSPAAEPLGSMPLSYAQQFSIVNYDDGSALITIGGTDRYLLLPEGMPRPEHDADAVLLQQPLGNLYLASSSTMDLFDQLGALHQVRFTSTAAGSWGIPQVAEAMARREILYAGKYSAPDFELLLSEGCGLAIQNTMIYHSPETWEKLVELGIPVLVERSSYETHPLGRTEWIKLYGLLIGKEAEAERFFEAQLQQLANLQTIDTEAKDVVFFYINAAVAAVVHKGGDYVAKMIELAGGRYVFEDLRKDETALSTVTLQMESFYAEAKDADVLIYSSAIGGDLETLAQLLQKSEHLQDFKAVQTGNVWCTEQNTFQQSSASAGIITDINRILSGQAAGIDSLPYMHRLS